MLEREIPGRKIRSCKYTNLWDPKGCQGAINNPEEAEYICIVAKVDSRGFRDHKTENLVSQAKENKLCPIGPEEPLKDFTH